MARGTVKRWEDEEGWGVVSSPDVPGDVWVHFIHIDADGFRALVEGEDVDFDWEQVPPPGQDGYAYRATRLVRVGQ